MTPALKSSILTCQLPGKNISITRRNAPNVNIALENCKWKHLPNRKNLQISSNNFSHSLDLHFQTCWYRGIHIKSEWKIEISERFCFYFPKKQNKNMMETVFAQLPVLWFRITLIWLFQLVDLWINIYIYIYILNQNKEAILSFELHSNRWYVQ